MIVSEADRGQKLVAAGVPQGFLDWLDHGIDYPDLRFVIRRPKSCYFYLPSIEHYKCLAGWDVTPICEGCNGDLYYVMLSRGVECGFIWFGLESEDSYTEFGSDFRYALAGILVQCYENSEVSIDELISAGMSFGFERSQVLFTTLKEADAVHLRGANDDQWRATNLPRIIGN